MPPTAFRDIAIIGIACRFPGADNPEAFWRNLVGGVESIARFSDDELLAAGIDARLVRDPHYVKAAPVIADHDGFDAGFFGCSPREARLMDPQHRHFLEVAWEAFEDAGYDPMGDNGVVAVFAGAGGLVSSYIVRQDHPELRGQTGDLGHIGNDRDFLPSRVAYKLGLGGPAVNVQTACSTSLVAVHLACRALIDGEAEMALAGASVVRVPHIAGYLAEPGGIASPDGHCRAFDAAGAGTLFGSGVAAVLLKPLAAALRDGDRVCAVVKGSAVTNDGAVKVSYTASTASAQARAMSEALALAGVAPDSIGFVECHGTATALGDPVEIQALTRAFRTGTGRTQFCAVGSVKSNFGHLEQCAGMAGLIKAALALDRGLIPPSLYFDTPNPRIPFARSPFFVNTEALPFPEGDTPRRAGVNSVGMGGTDAFVVLEEGPAPPEPPPPGRSLFALSLSAKNRAALRELAADFRARLAADEPLDLGDLCFTANCGRHHFAERFCAVGSDRRELAAALDRFAADGPPEPAAAPGPIAFLFSGQGAQYPQMGAALYRDQPVFRATLDRCLALFEAEGVALRETLFGDDDVLLSRTLYAQPALFSVEVALGELWRSWGIVPDIVLGHSVGEFAAAVTAGACTVEAAAQLVAARARLMEALPEHGAMVSVAAGVETVYGWLGDIAGRLAIAAENAADRTVVSGDSAAITALVERCRREGIPSARLKTSHAFHSPLMEPMLNAFAAAAAGIAFQLPKIRWISTLTGAEMAAAPDQRYWRRQIRERVRFRQAIEAAARHAGTFLEIGPGATLTALGRRCAPGAGQWLASLGGRGAEGHSVFEALAVLYRQGRAIVWNAVEPAGGRRIRLPTYPFQHERYWLDSCPPAPAAPPIPRGAIRPHALLGDRLGGEEAGFEALLGLDRFPFLGDHRVSGEAVMPTAAILDWLNAAADRAGFAQPMIEELVYERPLILAQGRQHWVTTTIETTAAGAAFRVESTGTAIDEPWLLHASGRLREDEEPPALPPFPAHRKRAAAEIPAERFYRFLDSAGLSYGPAFRGVRRLWRAGGEAFAEIALPSGLDDCSGYGLHPAFLDAALHVYAALVPDYGLFEGMPPPGPHVPVALGSFRLYRPGVQHGWVHAVTVEKDDGQGRLTADIAVFGEDGAPVALLRGLAVRRTAAESRAMPVRPDHRDLIYTIAWREAPLPPAAPTPARHWYIVADRSGVGERLAHALAADGATAVVTSPETAPLDKLLDDAPRCPVGIFYLGGLDLAAPPLADPTPVLPAGLRACGELLDLAQALDRARDRFSTPPILRLAIRAAAASPLAGVLRGLGRSFALEYPEMWGGLVDLPADAAATEAADLLRREIQTPDGETEIRWRDGKRWAARFARLAEPAATAPHPLAVDASYWIVGGLGRLGFATAQALVAAGARHLVLTGRGAPRSEAAAAIDKLADAAEIRVIRADIADEAAVAAALREIAATMPPLKGVIHAAAVFEDALLATADRSLFERVLRPKVAGAWHLHRATLGLDLDFFVLFSSVLSLWGGAGQSAYTAANGFLDALADYRRAQGLPASVFNWGPWEDAERGGAVGAAMWKQRATKSLPAPTCLDVLLARLHGDPAQIAVTDTRWRDFLAQFDAVPPHFRELAAAAEPAGSGDAAGRERPEDIIAEQAAGVLGLPRIDPERPLNELGLDSLLAVTLANRLRRAFGRAIPTAALLKGPSVRELAAQLFHDRPACAEEGKPAGARAAQTRGNRWLVFHRPNPEARLRLFAFPFAGGGAATFRPWADRLDSAIELVAIEPPGRQTRIDEPPIRDLDTLLNQLVPELLPFLDKPFAVYGHCLGALTLFETVRRLIGAHGIEPIHVFVSGARPPDQLQRQQDFEDELVEQLLKLPEYDLFEPIHQQPDEVFAAAIRGFNVPATEELVRDAELRRLMLPAIRAEFEMASNYRYQPDEPWDLPITCLTGSGDAYVSAENARSWARFTKRRFQLLTLDSEHFIVVDDDDFLLRIINRELTSPV